MDAATYWTAVGSVGTAAGSFIALVTIVTTIFLYRKQRNDEHAALIREDIRAFVSSANGLMRALRDGSPIIAAAWSARTVIQESLPLNSDVNRLREILKEGGVGLSVAVVSWERSSEAEALRGRIAALTDSGRRMTGTLNILSTAGEMLIAIADDARMTFLRLLTEDQVLAMFLEQTKNVTDLGVLLNAMAAHLHGNTAMYFVARYEEALKALDELITEVAIALGNLGAKRLVATAKAKSAITTNTPTDEMHDHLSALAKSLPTETLTKLDRLIDQVEKSVSKETARKRLDGEAQQGAPVDRPPPASPAVASH